MKLIGRSILFVLVTTVLLGGIYPAAVTVFARLLWSERASGSFLSSNGRVVGSDLIGQRFTGPRYLHPRPSAAGREGYDATASGGRNQGPTNASLAEAVRAAVESARKDRPGDPRPVPVDLVTASASGLDPHLSPDAAEWQAVRIANTRGVPEQRIREVIRRHVEPRTLGFLGEPRVNVLVTNLDLDASFPAP